MDQSSTTDWQRKAAEPWEVLPDADVEITTAGGAHICYCPDTRRALQICVEHNAVIHLGRAIRNVPLQP